MEDQMYHEVRFMRYAYSLADPNTTGEVVAKCHALTSPERLAILRMLYDSAHTVSEIARAMHMSVSTAVFHLNILKQAGLIEILLMPGKRGQVQLCHTVFTSLHIYNHSLEPSSDATRFVQDIPVGLYTAAEPEFPSGFCTREEQIMFDDGNIFTPRRAEAMLLWASAGFVEYTVSNIHADRPLCRIEVTLEVCSEIINYRIGWKSDITLWLNGRELVTFTSPSDFGGRRGRLNPDWWDDTSTQYGELKQVTVTEEGCFFCGERVMSAHAPTVRDFQGARTLILRIGNKPDAQYKGGFNLFGLGFGDHPQDIHVEIQYGDKA